MRNQFRNSFLVMALLQIGCGRPHAQTNLDDDKVNDEAASTESNSTVVGTVDTSSELDAEGDDLALTGSSSDTISWSPGVRTMDVFQMWPKDMCKGYIKWPVYRKIEGNRCRFKSARPDMTAFSSKAGPTYLCQVIYTCPEDSYCGGSWHEMYDPSRHVPQPNFNPAPQNNAIASTNCSGFGSQAPNMIGD